MSDDITIGTPSPVEPRLQQKRDALAKARAVKVANQAAARNAPQRTAADVQPVHHTPAARAEPAREATTGPEQVTRRKRADRVNSTDIPLHRRKPGWDYQWLAITVLNQPVDRSEIREFEEGGRWQEAEAREFPELCDKRAPPDSPVEVKGLRLYMRPLSFTNEAKAEDLKYAQDQQRDRMLAAASGKSAIRNEEGIPTRGGVRPVPVSVEIEGLAG